MKKCKLLVLFVLTLMITGSSFLSFNKIIENVGSKFMATTTHPASGPNAAINPSNSYLGYLYIYDGELKPEFIWNTYEYDIIVEPGTTELKMSYRPESTYSSVEVEGNENLVNGSKIKITVISQDGQKTPYTLTVKYANSKVVLIILIVLLSLIVLIGVTLLVLYMLSLKGIIKFKFKRKENIGADNYVK